MRFGDVVHNVLHTLSNKSRSLAGPLANAISIGANIKQGNVLKRVLEGNGNCLDFSLAMGIIAKRWYPSTDWRIIPFNYIENDDLKRYSRHDSFGFYFTEPGQESNQKDGFVCTFQGVVPVSALRNMDTLERYLRGLHEQDPDLNMKEGLRQFSSIAYEMFKKA